MSDTEQGALILYTAALGAAAKHLQIAMGQTDPAPWFQVADDVIRSYGSDYNDGVAKTLKAANRAKLALHRSLLDGSLAAEYFDGIESVAIPAWAWDGTERKTELQLSRLPLDPLLPPEWARWSGAPCYFDRRAFQTWLRSDRALSVGDLPSLPEPFNIGERPGHVTERMPPDTSWVSLTEAVSWVAFSISLDRSNLQEVIASGDLCGSPESARRALERAVADLVSKASGGTIEIIAKRVPVASLDYGNQNDTARTETIPRNRLIDFARFDCHYDALNLGVGVDWPMPPRDAHTTFPRDGTDSYRAAKVDRSALLKAYPPGRTFAQASPARAPDELPAAKVKRGPVPDARWDVAISDVAAQKKAANWTSPLTWGQKTKIATELIAWFEKPDGGPSHASAMSRVKKVSDLLPRREA